MDGLLTIDKPRGPTSHDVVARTRRVLGERRIGHTGTLDPMATGVLPLVVGRATRLARFLDAGEKVYDATLQLGIITDTHDALGTVVSRSEPGAWPGHADIDAALNPFRGSFLQQPPAFSAKKIRGRRSYELARHAGRPDASDEDNAPAMPAPVQVTAHAIEILDAADDIVRLRVVCSAGFYVRALVHDLGAALGVGAHLTALRRTASGPATLDSALPLERLEAPDGRTAAIAAMTPMDQMLPHLPALALTAASVVRAASGRDLGPSDAESGFIEAMHAVRDGRSDHVRLLNPAGHLVGIAAHARDPDALHPVVVLV